MRDGECDVVLAYALDRLSRDQNHIGVLFADAEDADVRLEFVTEDFEEVAVAVELPAEHVEGADQVASGAVDERRYATSIRRIAGHHLDVDGQRLCPLNSSAKMSSRAGRCSVDDAAPWRRLLAARPARAHARRDSFTRSVARA